MQCETHARLAELCARASDPHCALNLLGKVTAAVRTSAIYDLGFNWKANAVYRTKADYIASIIQVTDTKTGTLVICPVVRQYSAELTAEPFTVNNRVKSMVNGVARRVMDEAYLQLAMDLSREQEEHKKLPDIVCIGHGSGAAVAQILAATLVQTFTVREVVVFGPEPVGDDVWAHYWGTLDTSLSSYAIRGDARVKESLTLKHAVDLRLFPRFRERTRGLCAEDTVIQQFVEDTGCFMLQNVPMMYLIPSLATSLEDANDPITARSYAERLKRLREKREEEEEEKEEEKEETGETPVHSVPGPASASGPGPGPGPASASGPAPP